jgi:hypothetical protein
LDATDGLAAAVCHYYQFQPREFGKNKKSNSGFNLTGTGSLIENKGGDGLDAGNMGGSKLLKTVDGEMIQLNSSSKTSNSSKKKSGSTGKTGGRSDWSTFVDENPNRLK